MTFFDSLSLYNLPHVSLNGYTVAIKPAHGHATLTKTNQVVMPGDNVVYSIVLQNNTDDRCAAQVYIDGSCVGKFLLHANHTATIDRPVQESKKFTFFVGGSSGARMSGYRKQQFTNGLVEVRFIPEAKRSWFLQDDKCQLECTAVRQFSCNGTREGVTGLSGRSNQEFVNVCSPDLDHSKTSTIFLRLVASYASVVPSITPLPGKTASTYLPPVASNYYPYECE